VCIHETTYVITIPLNSCLVVAVQDARPKLSARDLLTKRAPRHQTPEPLAKHIRRNGKRTDSQVDDRDPVKHRAWSDVGHDTVRVGCRDEGEHRLCEVDGDESLVCIFGVAVNDVGQTGCRCERHGERVNGHEYQGPDDGVASRSAHTKAEETDRGEDDGRYHQSQAEFRFEDALVAAGHELCESVGCPAGQRRANKCDNEER